MADGQAVTSPKVVVALASIVEGFASTEPFYVIELDDRWNLIVGMRWLEAHQQWIDWRSKTMHKAALANPPSNQGVMSNELTPLHGSATQFVTRPAPSATRLATESAAFGDVAKTGDELESAAIGDAATIGHELELCSFGLRLDRSDTNSR
ncbi:hypothetical protein H310_04685 [Aphanomyces invadans]|uniref:Uncharacterized protein n=1 Tax=Aphanomyces invadans TaxID=157072 RepID=A0A024UDU2_9STRA|nr:hypothetical protein H310_04685 [Aphanomyces invadans]ETW04404.1 hypothetical protein H310_04685 [Aphanomyces invadans]|eukprot:XP_008867360.1 hypothetical protein H310_04685 [Aphanomyces invadans]